MEKEKENEIQTEYIIEEGKTFKMTREPVIDSGVKLAEVRDKIASKENEAREIDAELVILRDEESQLTNIVSE